MKIYRCDRCGVEKAISTGIIGSELDLYGFGTLNERFRTDGVVDVCKTCLAAAEAELENVRRKNRDRETRMVTARIRSAETPKETRPNFIDRWSAIIRGL